jgi:hypothetical protein
MADTMLPGGRGIPTLRVSDHGLREVQVAADRREEQDREIKAVVAEIEAGEWARRVARPAPMDELKAGQLANEAIYADRRAGLARAVEELAVEGTLIDAALAGLPVEAPPPTRWGRPLSQAQLAYEQQQLEAFLAGRR